MNNIFTNKNSRFVQSLRDIVFGLEDGMVSTLGAITGIAIGSQNHFTVLLSGFVIIAVESISMGIGSYVSNKSDRDRDINQLRVQKKEIKEQMEIEKKDLLAIYYKDGWPNDLANQMADFASQNKKLMLKEKALHELSVLPEQITSPKINGLFMFFSYIIGGMIALTPYLFMSVKVAMPISISATLFGLFLVGVFTSLYTKKSWFKSGVRVLLIGGLALLAGVLIGELASRWGIGD
jgi:predicted membrane protein (TIGR00267 family)